MNACDLIYLDHNATTPIDTAVSDAMMPFLSGEFGNPSSAYALGKRAGQSLEKAREDAARLLGCSKEEIIFTSGGSESNNTVIKGIVDFKRPRDFHIITSAVEHPAILNPLLYLMELGVSVSILPVDRYGVVDPDEIRKAVNARTGLISIMLANNETGTLQPIKEISRIAREHDIPFHTDAAQAVGKIPVNVRELGVDFLTVAGHKLYAPKGVGALYMKENRHLTPLIHGAGQEEGRRAGTENVMLAVGLGKACDIAHSRMESDVQVMKKFRARLQDLLFSELDDLVLNGRNYTRTTH